MPHDLSDPHGMVFAIVGQDASGLVLLLLLSNDLVGRSSAAQSTIPKEGYTERGLPTGYIDWLCRKKVIDCLLSKPASELCSARELGQARYVVWEPVTVCFYTRKGSGGGNSLKHSL